MRADNRGEGGILALLALQSGARTARWTRFATVLGLLGAGLLYGDGAITPAISILGAVEGLEVVTPALAAAVVPVTVLILSGSSRFSATARPASAPCSAGDAALFSLAVTGPSRHTPASVPGREPAPRGLVLPRVRRRGSPLSSSCSS
jgi:hypothetical protein